MRTNELDLRSKSRLLDWEDSEIRKFGNSECQPGTLSAEAEAHEELSSREKSGCREYQAI